MKRKAVKFDLGKATILDVLQRSKCPVKSRTLANYTDTAGVDSTNATVRKMIKALVNDGHPIASCRDGYFLVKTNQHLHEFLLRHNKRIRAHAVRTDQVIKNFQKYQL